MENNTLSYFTVGLWFEKSSNISSVNNNFNVVYPEVCQNLLKSVGSHGIVFTNNTIKGKISDTPYAVDSDSTGVVTDNNNFNEFYTYSEELSIMKH